MRCLLKVGQALENLATESSKVADALINKLKSLCVSDFSRFKSLRKAIVTLWSAREIEDLEIRLQRMRDVLQFRILISIKEDNLATPTSDNVLKPVKEIVISAFGVFLWVKLVVDFLLGGEFRLEINFKTFGHDCNACRETLRTFTDKCLTTYLPNIVSKGRGYFRSFDATNSSPLQGPIYSLTNPFPLCS